MNRFSKIEAPFRPTSYRCSGCGAAAESIRADHPRQAAMYFKPKVDVSRGMAELILVSDEAGEVLYAERYPQGSENDAWRQLALAGA